MFVCLFVPYTNPHFWTDRNQTLHTSPPWSGRDCRVCMGPQYFTFPTFSTYFVGSRCRFMHTRWLPAPHSPLLRYICDAARAGVTSRTVGCAMKTRRSERNVCVWKWKPVETGWNWLMNWTCSCIAVIQMITGSVMSKWIANDSADFIITFNYKSFVLSVTFVILQLIQKLFGCTL